jgi:hypothetical protein
MHNKVYFKVDITSPQARRNIKKLKYSRAHPAFFLAGDDYG